MVEALNNDNEHRMAIASMRDEIAERVTFAAKMINESKYMHTVIPNGAFYIFPRLNMEKLSIKDDREFVTKLLEEEQIQIARGSGFGEKDHIRIVALAEKEVLGAAIGKIEAFCRRHSK
jgi:alanine-synthesizing transaminase